jgi:acyl-CoA reductase-like NAD-dependent aldehyde dehydrogenase
MREISMTIGGGPVLSAASFTVENPATGETIAAAAECSSEQLDTAMRCAEQAMGAWMADAPARRAALRALADAVAASSEELASLITDEQGKPLAEARSEVRESISELRYFADLEVPAEVIGDGTSAAVRLTHRPVGPVAAITPWNFPLGTAITKIAPSLAAGCTMVLKPSPFTPLACLRFGELTRTILPPGVLNIISGSDQVGAWMSQHPIPRMVSFTGSVSTGKRIAAAAAPDLKRVVLELGGNDPAVVLDDADIDQVADRLFANAFANCGQVCTAIKRVYVPERLHGDYTAALADRARAARVGDGRNDHTDIGPLCNGPQQQRIIDLVADAIHRGARVAAGGKAMDGPGHFFEPTVLTSLDESVRIVGEEQFGPAIPVMAYSDVDQVIRRANDTRFGLGASIWTSDPERGAQLAARIESGTVWVNTHQDAVPGQPFGGMKWSGSGVEGGMQGLIGYTDLQVVYVRQGS